jgi:hypothetical protein
MGGLGVFLPSDVASYAYIASLLSSLALQNKILRTQPDFVPDFIPGLVNTFAETIYPHDRDRATTLASETIAPHSKHQFSMAQIFNKAKRSALLQHSFLTTAADPLRRRFQVILDSAAQASASSWLFALPNAGMHQRMSPLEFQAAASFRLLIQQFPEGQQCQCSRCPAILDSFGYHSVICNGRERFARHEAVRDALSSLASLARFHPKNNAPVQCLGLDRYSPLSAC